MPNPPLTWEDAEREETTPSPTPKGGGEPWWETFLSRVDTILPQVVRLMELAPNAIEGGRLKVLLERNKKSSENGTVASKQTDAQPSEQYTPGTAFVGLYEVAKYLAVALPTLTVRQAIEGMQANVPLPEKLLSSLSGYMDQKLSTVLLFGLPLKQQDIQAFLARLPELDPSHVPVEVPPEPNS